MEQAKSNELDKHLAARLAWFDAFTKERCGRAFGPSQLAKWLADLDAGRPYEPAVQEPYESEADENHYQLDKYGGLVLLGTELRNLQDHGEEPDPGHIAQVHFGRQEILLGFLAKYIELGSMDVAFDLPGVLHMLLASRFPLAMTDRVRALIYSKVPDTYDEAIDRLALSNDGLQLLLVLVAGIGTRAVGFSDTPASDVQLQDSDYSAAFNNLVAAAIRAMDVAADDGLRPETVAGALLTLAADQPDMTEETRLSLAGLFMWSLKDLLEPLSAVQRLPEICEELAAREMSASLRVSVDSARFLLKSMRPRRPS